MSRLFEVPTQSYTCLQTIGFHLKKEAPLSRCRDEAGDWVSFVCRFEQQDGLRSVVLTMSRL